MEFCATFGGQNRDDALGCTKVSIVHRFFCLLYFVFEEWELSVRVLQLCSCCIQTCASASLTDVHRCESWVCILGAAVGPGSELGFLTKIATDYSLYEFIKSEWLSADHAVV